ncbi:hypothetical protein SD70_17050 [Gordoniibacillus kamchatkensis]|uniref:Uncharacterized protein n=1 Tax=Gordoniibacillus kamchatkensis TaxID=1590651 RepID=A0ABR5AFV5_9BACL|nr:hypothetical protein [Paenibacillus sp. VKM B-2647]KIL39929.1 hypothetical protein SD70_17050 [Paenibacillus sp. VKM B-2647]
MIYGTMLLDTDMELFVAALSQTPVLVWQLNEHDMYVHVDSGIILKFAPDYVQIRSVHGLKHVACYPRDHCEFSVRLAGGQRTI